MGNYEQLKQSVSDVIKTNGNQEITGSILQNVLLTIISSVGANATFVGIATPTTNPGTPDGPVFYLASESGTYSNFGSIELQAGLSVLMWNGSWSSQQIFGIDNEPTAGSDNLVKSGGVQEELALGTVYDVSAKNPTAGVNNDGKWESLSALLSDANLNTLIPTAVRKGGMSIKFVQSSDNKYVQARLMANSFTTDVTQWQNVDDKISELEGGVNTLYEELYLQESITQGATGEGKSVWNAPIAVQPNSKYRITFSPTPSFSQLAIMLNNGTEVTPIYNKHDVSPNFMDIVTKPDTISIQVLHNVAVGVHFTIVVTTIKADNSKITGMLNDIAENKSNIAEAKLAILKHSTEIAKATEQITRIDAGYIHKQVTESKSVDIESAQFVNTYRYNADGTKVQSATALTTNMIDLPENAYVTTDYHPCQSADLGVGALFDENKNFLAPITRITMGYPLSSWQQFVYQTIKISVQDIMANAGASGVPKYVVFTEWTNNPNQIELGAKVEGEYHETKEMSIRTAQKNLLVVDAHGNGDYLTLDDAIDNANDSIDNPVTILVLPGKYETKTAKGDIEKYKAKQRYLSIIGTDKENCIIFNNKGNYTLSSSPNGYEDNACLRLAGNCYVANLTFISTAENYVDLPNNEKRSYCVHLDFDTNDGDVCEFNNCTFYNDHWCCFGIGTRDNYKIVINNCEFKSTFNSTFGCIFAHTTATSGSESNILQELIIIRTQIDTEDLFGVAINAAANQYMRVTFAGNIIVAKQQAANIPARVVLGKMSYGNFGKVVSNINQ